MQTTKKNSVNSLTKSKRESGLTARMAWTRTLVGLISLWLVSNPLFGNIPVNYAATNPAGANSQNSSLTLPALNQINPAPDLALTAGNITFSTDTPLAGLPLTITLGIHNIGQINVATVSVLITDTFTVDNKVVTTRSFPQAIHDLAPQQQTSLAYSLQANAPYGLHLLCVELADVTPIDSQMFNNQACRALTIIDPSQPNPQLANLNDNNTTLNKTTLSNSVAAKDHVQSVYGKIPLSFEQNLGQTDPQVKFLSHGQGYTLFLTPNEALLSLQKAENETPSGCSNGPQWQAAPGESLLQACQQGKTATTPNKETILGVSLVGANTNIPLKGEQALPGKTNYLIGNDPNYWQTDVPQYARISYPQVYPGIDLSYYGNQQQLEYDFEVAAGADPNLINLKFSGVNHLELAGTGELVLHNGNEEIRQKPPIFYQLAQNGTHKPVKGSYVLKNEMSEGSPVVGFKIEDYDHTKPLIIDPVLVYASYFGGSGDDVGRGITIDSQGNAYVTGYTTSLDFPGSPGPSGGVVTSTKAAFVLKLNPQGTGLLYATYLAGQDRAGSGTIGYSIGVDANSNAYVAGWTTSSDFPISGTVRQKVSGGAADGFVTKLNPAGNGIIYSTYLGGSGNDFIERIIVDQSGNVIFVGDSNSTNLTATSGVAQSTHGGGYDAFVGKLNLVGNTTAPGFLTFYGGSGDDYAADVAVDSSGNIYFTGSTNSTNFRTVPTATVYQATYQGGTSDCFVVKLKPAATNPPVYATYIGATANDGCTGIAVDAAGSAYVIGQTYSPDFPVSPGALQTAYAGGTYGDGFAFKLDAAGSNQGYGTFLGGSGTTDNAYAIAVDSDGNATIGGYTDSPDFPPLKDIPGAFQKQLTAADGYLIKLNSTGSSPLLYGTYLGGSLQDGIFDLAQDSNGNVYVTGFTYSSDFPTTSGLPSGEHTFVAKLALSSFTTPDQIEVRVSDQLTWQGAKTTVLAKVRNTGAGPVILQKAALDNLNPSWATVTLLSPLPSAPINPGAEAELTFDISVPNISGVSFPLDQTPTLLVTTAQGVSASTGFSLTILQVAPTNLIVNVVDQNNAPLNGVWLATGFTDNFYQTSGAGTVTIPSLAGDTFVYSFIPGYLAQADPVTILAQQNNFLTIKLTPGDTLEVSSVNTTQLSAAQIAADGVVLSDPANQVVYNFQVNLSIGTYTIPDVILPANPQVGIDYPVGPYPGKDINWGPSQGSSTSPPQVAGTVRYLSPTQRLETWIVIPGKFRILKQFWDANIYITNRAMSPSNLIVITNTTATLNVPQGLTLPALNGVSQNATQSLGKIDANQSKQVTWIVRGDAPGAYQLGANISGALQFGTNPNTIPLTSNAQPATLEVYQPTLDVNYTAPSYMQAGQPFTLKIDLINTTPITLTQVVVQLDANQIQNAHLKDPTASSQTLTNLKPAALNSVSFQLVSDLTGCVNIPNSFVVADPHITPHLNFTPSPCGGLIGHTDCQLVNNCRPLVGNYLETNLDFILPAAVGSNLPFEVVRTYNSADTTIGSFGVGWRSNFDTKLIFGTDSSISALNGMGHQDMYVPDHTNPNNYVGIGGATGSLVKWSSTYTLTLASPQISYIFDTSGRLTQLRDGNFYILTVAYNATTGNIATVKDNYNRTLTFTYQNKLLTVITDGTRTINYGYGSGASRLQTFTDAVGNTTTYGYNGLGFLNEKRNSDNQPVLQNTYDGQNRLVRQTAFDGSGQSASVSYDFDSHPGKTVMTDTNGAATIFTIDPTTQLPIGALDPGGHNRNYTLNSNGFPVAVTTTGGAVLRSTYNAKGLPTSATSQVTVDGLLQTISSQITYDTNNIDPITITDPNGNTVHLHYFAPGKPDSITDQLGNTTTYQYDTLGRPSKITAPDGLVSQYTYTAFGQIATITRVFTTLVPGSTTPVQRSYRTNFTYTAQGWLASESDPYDLAVTTSPTANTSYQYNTNGQVMTTTNQLGQHSYNQYDKAGNLVSVTDFQGHKTLYTYDRLNRMLSATQVGSSGNLVTSYTYDQNNNVTSVKDPRGVVTTYSYDNLNRLISTKVPLQDGTFDQIDNTYNATGKVATTTHFNPKGSRDEVSLFEYDELGRLVTTTLGAGVYNYITVKIYDKNDNVILTRMSKGDGSTVTNWGDPAQVITTSATYDARNRLTSQTSYAYGGSNHLLTTRYSYTDTKDLTSVTSPGGIVATRQTDALARLISTTIIPATGPQIQAGATPTTGYNYYDPRGLLIRSLDPAGDQQDMTYDALGRPTVLTSHTGLNGTGTTLTKSIHYVDGLRPQVTTVGPAPNYQREDAWSDEFGRVLTTTTYTGAAVAYPTIPQNPLTVVYGYDAQGNRTSITEPNGHVTNYSYENTGWVKNITQTVTVPGQGLKTLVTKYDYDSVGNLTKLTDANGYIRTTSYDVLNRPVAGWLGGHGVNNETKTYDGLGRLLSYRDSIYNTINYTYDNASRLLQIDTYPQTTFTYNDGGQILSMFDNKWDIPVTTTLTTYQYDGLNRLTSSNSPQGAVAYRYDSLNRRSSLNFNNKTVNYSYDSLNRVISLTNWLSQTVTYKYNGERLSQVLYPNGVSNNYTYNGSGQITTVLEKQASGTVLLQDNYTLDKLGNITATAENLLGVARNLSYSYDELSRLMSEVTKEGTSQPLTNTYQYDGVGNRLQMTQQQTTGEIITSTYSYHPSFANALYSIIRRSSTSSSIKDEYLYGLDSNGNLGGQIYLPQGLISSSMITTNYRYDGHQRLSATWKGNTNSPDPSIMINYFYNGLNQRTAVISGTVGGSNPTQNSVYLNDITTGSVLEERLTGLAIPSGIAWAPEVDPTKADFSYLYAPGASQALARDGLWYGYDTQGSVRTFTDSTGQSQGKYAYDAFGVTKFGTDNSSLIPGARNTREFEGQQLDTTGLYYTRCGYYNPMNTQILGANYCLAPAGPGGAHSGNGVNAKQAQTQGTMLSLHSGGPAWQGGNCGCDVNCHYTVDLLQQPSPIQNSANPKPWLDVKGWMKQGIDVLAQMLEGMGQELAGSSDSFLAQTFGTDTSSAWLGSWNNAIGSADAYLKGQVDVLSEPIPFPRQELETALSLISAGLDFVPGLGEVKMFAEAELGRDLLTGRHLSDDERLMSALPFLGEMFEAEAIGEAIDEVVKETEDSATLFGADTGKGADAVEQANLSAEANATLARSGTQSLSEYMNLSLEEQRGFGFVPDNLGKNHFDEVEKILDTGKNAASEGRMIGVYGPLELTSLVDGQEGIFIHMVRDGSPVEYTWGLNVEGWIGTDISFEKLGYQDLYGFSQREGDLGTTFYARE